MTHKIYIGKYEGSKTTRYALIHTSTDWKKDAAQCQKGFNLIRLQGYMEGVAATSLGDIEVLNGIPIPLEHEMKLPTCRPVARTALEQLLKSISN